MFDEVEMLADLPHARWPLHPEPHSLERLDTYVRRLAGAYGVGLATFCQHGLGCEPGDLDRYRGDLPQAFLDDLARGTGQSIRRLRNMTEARCHAWTSVALLWIVRCDPEIVYKMARGIPGQREFVDGI